MRRRNIRVPLRDLEYPMLSNAILAIDAYLECSPKRIGINITKPTPYLWIATDSLETKYQKPSLGRDGAVSTLIGMIKFLELLRPEIERNVNDNYDTSEVTSFLKRIERVADDIHMRYSYAVNCFCMRLFSNGGARQRRADDVLTDFKRVLGSIRENVDRTNTAVLIN